VASLLRYTGGGRVLDIGCGSGFHDFLMAQSDHVTHVTGIDYSSASVARANEVFPHEKVTRYVADCRELSTGSYDIVVSYCVITHLTDWQSFMDTCRDLVRPGGYVGVYTPNARRIENRLRAAIGKPPALIDPQHYGEASPEEVKNLGASAGLEFVASFGYGLNLPSPGLDWVPRRWSLNLGRFFPSLSTRMGLVFKRRPPNVTS